MGVRGALMQRFDGRRGGRGAGCFDEEAGVSGEKALGYGGVVMDWYLVFVC